MSAMRKMAEYLGLVDGNEVGEQYEYAEEVMEYTSVEAVANPVARPMAVAPAVGNYDYTPRPSTPVAPAQVATSSPALVDMYKISTITPHTYNDARRIGEEFREGIPVILNLSEMNEADARRIVDFSAGLVFGLRGSIESVTKGVYVLSPANVDIASAARAQLREDPFFNQS